MKSNVDKYWKQFIDSLHADEAKPPRYVESFFFGTQLDTAREITQLVLDGTKTATGDFQWSIEPDGRQQAQVGNHWVVTNGGDTPACIIQTFDVQVFPYDEVPEEYAFWGGEGDRTVKSWRDLYWNFIVGECKRIGRSPDKKAPLVMERFRVVYDDPLRKD